MSNLYVRLADAIDSMDLSAAIAATDPDNEARPLMGDVVADFRACLAEQGLRILDEENVEKLKGELGRKVTVTNRLLVAIEGAIHDLAPDGIISPFTSDYTVGHVVDALRKALEGDA